MNSKKRYQKLDLLGKGGYGSVYKAIDTANGETVAIKKVKLDVDTEGIPSTSLRELCILKKASNEHIVKLLNFINGNSSVRLVLECAETDVRNELTEKFPLPEAVIRNYMKQTLTGLYYLHSQRLIHRDIKLNNLLLKNGVVKIADFGLARFFDLTPKEYTSEVVTLWYRAPELLLGFKEYSCGVDLWSIGCIFAELYTKDPLFQGDCAIDQLFKIFQLLGTPDEHSWPGLKEHGKHFKMAYPKWKRADLASKFPMMGDKARDLLSKLLEYDPAKRISAKSALKHPYFTE